MFHRRVESFDHFFELLWDNIRWRKDSSRPGSEPPPWDDWDLDPKFFSALSRWTIEHPESSLDRILDKICVGIDIGTPLLDLIPSSPFPARGLIGALAHLVQLGATISSARRDVQAFAKEIIHWVSQIKVAIEEGKGGRVTSKTRKNFTEMRNLIDEICKWATARLEDGRWSRIGHAFIIAKEIDDFRSRIAKARAIFMHLSVINLSQGQDAIIQSVQDLIVIIRLTQKEHLSRILVELSGQREAMDAQAKAMEAQRKEMEAQKQAKARREFLSRVLSPQVVTNTAYSEQGKRPCDSDTRMEILADIKDWVYDISDGAKRFLWLTGDPGSGKSAITASVTRECKDGGILWAQFFINRNLDKTTNSASYFPSIARQLADRSPKVALTIHDTLREQPSLLDDISQRQAGKLFVDSLKVASSTSLSKPVVVVIDGLDETDATRLRYTAEIFSKALVDLPCNAKVFISSRTEDDIRKPFSDTFHVNHVKHVHLDTAADSSIRDVSTYLTRNIVAIVERHHLDVLQWPGEERMRELCNQASGLFIWAVTTIKFIEDQIEMWGRGCLDDVLNELNSQGMGDINVLYGAILRLTHRNQTDPLIFESFRRIIGCIVVLQKPLCLADIASLLYPQKESARKHVDIENYVRRLRTVLVAGTNAVDGQTVPRLHKSFFEFITSERAESRFRVSMGTSHAELATQCLRQLASLRNDATAENNFHPPRRYALEFWASHSPQGTIAGVAVASPFSRYQLQQLLRSTSHRPIQISSVHVALLSDRQHILLSTDDAICLRGPENLSRIRSSLNGHTGAVLCSAFSPNGTKIVSGSADGTIRLWNAQSSQPIRSPLQGHTAAVYSIAFSPDGNQIVSGSSDGTLRLWDARSGHSTSMGYNIWAFSVAFSLDGKQIVSGSSDYTLRLWDARNGRPINSPLMGHTDIVHSVAFSPDGKHVLSGSADATLRLWDVQSGQSVGSPFTGHTNSVNSAAFSPDGKQIISGSADGTLRLWDVQTSQPIGSPFNAHSSKVTSVAFSPNGTQVISGSSDTTLRLWNLRTGQPFGAPFDSHASTVTSVAFSPNGTQVVSSSRDKTLCIWDLLPTKFYCENHTDSVTSIGLSPDGSKIVSASLDNTVRVWNVDNGQAIGSPLKHNINRVVSLAFSPDGSHLAGASSDSIVCLWDAESHKLLASYRKDCISMMSRITFSGDGNQLMTFSIDGTTYVWDAISGKPIQPLQPVDLDNNELLTATQDEIDNALLRWFPVDNPNFGHWAYIDSTLILRDKNGLTTVTDMSEVERKWKASLGTPRAEVNIQR